MLVLGLDLETTGLDTRSAEIIEVGAVVWDCNRGVPVQMMDRFVKISGEIPAEVKAITNIDDSDLETFGLDIKDVLTELNALSQFCDYVVAHNGNSYDKPILERYWQEMPDLKIDKPWIDTMVDVPFSKNVGSLKLPYLAADHNFLNPFSHRAVFDVLTMLKIFSEYDLKKVTELQSSPLKKVVAKVSFEEKDKAKNMGFRWDPKGKQWYMELKELQLGEMEFPFPTQVF